MLVVNHLIKLHTEKKAKQKTSLLTHIFICCQGSLVQNTTQSRGASSNPSPTQTSCPWDHTPLDAPSGGSKWDLAKLGTVKFSIRGLFYTEDLVLTLRKRKKITFSLLRTAVCGLSSQSEKNGVAVCGRLRENLGCVLVVVEGVMTKKNGRQSLRENRS